MRVLTLLRDVAYLKAHFKGATFSDLALHTFVVELALLVGTARPLPDAALGAPASPDSFVG
jgi:hypothetical protein